MAHAYQARGSNSRGYQYIELSEAQNMGEGIPKTHVYAVVVDCTIPRDTQGTDRMCTLRIADPSTVAEHGGGPGSGMTLLCFAPDAAQLPRLRRPGDIIRVHRAKVRFFNGHPQLIASESLRGGKAAFCLFDGSPRAGDEPYQASSRNYHFDERERAILASIREFSQGGTWQTAMHPVIPISRVRPSTFYDIVAKVLAVETREGEPTMLFLWDATDAAPFPPTETTHIEAAAGQPAPRVRRLPLQTMDAAAVAALPWRGAALPFAVNVPDQPLPPAGTWVKLRNVNARVVEGQLQGVFTYKSRWSPWQEDAGALERYRQRMAAPESGKAAAEAAPEDPGHWLSALDDPSRPFSTLRQVLADAKLRGAQPTLYRCLVRVLRYRPCGGALRTLCCQARDHAELAQSEGYDDPEAWMFAGSLMLEDGTARAGADVLGRDGERFFSRVAPPGDLGRDADALRALRGALEATLGVGYLGEGVPWLDIGLASFFPDPSAPLSVRFRIKHCTLRPPTFTGPAPMAADF